MTENNERWIESVSFKQPTAGNPTSIQKPSSESIYLPEKCYIPTALV